jgi:hypothetical protein
MRMTAEAVEYQSETPPETPLPRSGADWKKES